MAGVCCANAGPRGPQGPPGDLTVVTGVAAAACPPTSTTRSVDVDAVAAPGSAIIGARLSPCFGLAVATGNLNLQPSANDAYLPVPGAQVVLPEAGTYDVQYTASGWLNLQGPSGSGVQLLARLFNVTAAAAVPGSGAFIVGVSQTDAVINASMGSAHNRVFITVAAPTTIRLEGARHTINGTPISATGIFNALAPHVDLTNISFLKIAD